MDKVNATHSFSHAAGNYHLMGCMLSAASCLKWWTEDICKTLDYNSLCAEIRKENLGKNHVFFLPYLMGERAPHNDPLARGVFIGMTMDTTRADMTQAVLEGIAFAYRDMVESARPLGIRVNNSTLCGGGAKNAVWQEILTNVLNLPLTILKEEQGPGLGAAMLSALSRGQYLSLRHAADATVRISHTVKPTMDIAKAYDQRYQVFQQIYPALRDIYPLLPCNSLE